MDEVLELTAPIFESLSDETGEIIQAHTNQFRTNCMGFVALTILLWDHIATFSDEVEYVWYGSNGPIKYLFLLNRYLIPLGFSINIFAYLSPALSNVPGTPSAEVNVPLLCADFIRFEGSLTVIGINVVAIMMFYRVYALYWNPPINLGRHYVYMLAVVLLVEFVVNAWLLTKGGPVKEGLGCEMVFIGVPPSVASASAWLPLLFDTMAFLLIVRATFKDAARRKEFIQNGPNLQRRILEDGLLYYCPILLVTLSLSLMISFSAQGTQNLMAQLELIITVTMMSRITFNLKKAAHKRCDIDYQLASIPNPVNGIVGHARAQITSVLDISRSRGQNEHGDDMEMGVRNRNFDSASEVDVEFEFRYGGTGNCVKQFGHSSEETIDRR